MKVTFSGVFAAACLTMSAIVVPSLATVAPSVQAAGTPDIELTKEMPLEHLYGKPIPVELTMTNPTTTDGFNTTFTDLLPPGVSLSSATPAPTTSTQQSDGSTLLVWSNIADALAGASVAINYEINVDPSEYDVDDTVTNAASVYVNSDPRYVPKVGSTGTISDATGSADANASTLLIPFELTKSEPSPEDELLRGVHNHHTVYTLTIENNQVNPTTGFTIVDYLPADLEFLGCAPITDNSTGGDEYTGSGPIPAGSATPNPCAEPSSVTTVTTDPDGAGPMPSGVYTRVEWDAASIAAAVGSADLAGGGTFMIDYIAAIPLYANTQATLTDPTANLDNNTGALTTETERSVSNYAEASGTYNNRSSASTDSDIETVVPEDISLLKSVDNEEFDQASTPVFTLTVRSSEYATQTGPITVTDTIPAALDFISATPAPTSGPTSNADGTETYTWVLPAFSAPSSTATIVINTDVREEFRGSGEPVGANDTMTNTAALTADVEVITDSAGTTQTESLDDESEADLYSGAPTILKSVSEPTATLTCGDGTGLTFVPSQAGPYRAGDRVCFKLEVDFPTRLDTIDPIVDDYLPEGFVYESFAWGPNNTVPQVGINQTGQRLRWELNDSDAVGDKFEVIVQAAIGSPDFRSGDIIDNLMKFRFDNRDGATFQYRDQAFVEQERPKLGLSKGITELNGNAVPGAPSSDVTVEEGDRVAYQLDVENTGDQTAFDTSIRDVLPPGITCAAVDAGSISDGGVCDAANDWIQWGATNNIDIAAGTTATLTYEIVVPIGVSAGAAIDNEAGVRTFVGETNTGTTFEYVPRNNVDDTLTSNTDSADDIATIRTNLPLIDKQASTSIDATGNSATEQATIGETISYTVEFEVPAGVTLYNAHLVDNLDSEKTLDPTSVVVTRNGTAVPIAPSTPVSDNFTITTTGNAIDVAFPTPYTVPAGSPHEFVMTFDAVVVDVASNAAASTTTNSVEFNYEDATGDSRSVNDSVSTTIVEPDISVTKADDDADGVVVSGQAIGYTVTVSNADGSSNSVAYDTVIVDTVPPELVVDTATISDGGVFAAGATAADPSTITWTVATIDPGASAVLTYDATTVDPLIAGSSLTNAVSVVTTSMPGTTSDERDSSSTNNDGYAASTANSVAAQSVTVTKAANPTSATVGEAVTYTLDVVIPGQVVVYDVTVIDALPPGIVFESLTSVVCSEGGGACSPDINAAAVVPASGHASGSDVAFFIDDVTPAAATDRTVTITYVAVVADDTAADSGASLTNSAVVAWNESDSVTATPTTVPDSSSFDDASEPSESTVGTTEPTLVLDKDVAGQVDDADQRRAKPGDTLTYTLSLTNTGTSPAYDVTVTDVPTDATWAFADTTVATDVVNSDSDPAGGLGWTIAGPIPVGGVVEITYTLTVPADYDSSNEDPAGAEQTNVADVPSYFGVPQAERTANPDRAYRAYDDVTSDAVEIELDLASIGDQLWFDVNNDGIQQPGEPVLANVDVTVTYLGPDGVLGTADDEVHNTATDANGEYLVDDLPGGSYVVDPDESDSDMIPGIAPNYDLDDGLAASDGVSAATLGEDQDFTDVDFGYTGSGSIGDQLWFDQDADGVYDSNEAPLAGVEVLVTWLGPDGVAGGGDDVEYRATTDANGQYTVQNLPSGAFTVTVDPDGTTLPSGYSNVSDPDGGNDATSALTLAAGEAVTDQDFGFAGTGTLGDTIYLDQNGDGDQDTGEPSLVGVTVELVSFGPDGVLGGTDDSTFTTVTDASGNYLFDRLPQGEFQVTVLGGITLIDNSGDPDGGGDSTSLATLTAAQPSDLDQDFGYHADSVLGDRVWWDRNADGVQDADEPGLAGVTVRLESAALATALTTTTDANGDYIFENIPDGDYTIVIESGVGDGFEQTFDASGDQTDQTSTSSLVDSDLGQDFGYTGSGSIGDTIWFDTDGDGAVGASEFGIPGVTVELTWYGPDGVPGGDDDIVLTTQTDEDGGYSFGALPHGEFVVDVDESTLPDGVVETYDRDGDLDNQGTTPVTLTGTANQVDDVDFGYRGGGSIGDTIWFDRDGDGEFDSNEHPLEGVTVTLTWHAPGGSETFTTTTDANGEYLFPQLAQGDYTVEVDTTTVPTGMTPTYDADQDAAGLGSTSSLTLAENEVNTDQDFGYRGSGSIGDTIYVDLDGDGVQGDNEPGVANQTVIVGWQGPSGRVTFTTTTDANGNYLFDGLPPGDYDVTVVNGIVNDAINTGDPTEAGTGDSTNTLTLALDEVNTDQDFGYQGQNSIGDTVWFDLNADGVQDVDDPGLAGVEVTAVWFGPDGLPGTDDDVTLPATTTDADGNYRFDGLPDGNFSVTVTGGVPDYLDSSTFDPDDGTTDPDSTAVVVGLGEGVDGPAENLDQNFGFAGSGQIGDTIWLDLNGDGVHDDDEPGVPGIEVQLTFAGPDGVIGGTDDVVYPAVVTDADGNYLLDSLPSGHFQVDLITSVTSMTLSTDPDGDVDGSSVVDLDDGGVDLDQDFAYVGSAGVGDTVWLDVNGNGEQDDNEPGIAGVVVTVVSGGADGELGTADDIIIEVVTDESGEYLVTGLPSGPTKVSYDPDLLSLGVEPGSDLDGDVVSEAVIDLAADETRTDVDFGAVGTASIGGVVFTDNNGDGSQGSDEAGIGGVTIEVTYHGPDGPVVMTTVTNADGSWSIDGIPSGEYTTTVVESTVPDGLTATLPTNNEVVVPVGGAAQVVNGYAPNGSIGDFVFVDTNGNGVKDGSETGLAGITITASNGAGDVRTVVTDADGRYSFEDLPPGEWTISFDMAALPEGLVLTLDPDGTNDGTTTVTVGPGEEVHGIDFGARTENSLPTTGSNLGRVLLFAALLFGAGWLLWGITRRRRMAVNQ